MRRDRQRAPIASHRESRTESGECSREEAAPTAARAAWFARKTAIGDAEIWPMGGVCGIVLALTATLYLLPSTNSAAFFRVKVDGDAPTP